MNSTGSDNQIINLPNMVSFVRILIAPVLIYLAIQQQPNAFLVLLLVAAFTDVLDGFLARHLNQITDMGSHLDSWGDFTIYTTMTICAWVLWPEILERVAPYFLMMVLSFTLPVAIGLIKFKAITSYHTWSVKFAVLVTYVSYIILFSEIQEWPFRVAAFICVYAAIEEICITLMMPHQRVDVRSVWHAMKYRTDK